MSINTSIRANFITYVKNGNSTSYGPNLLVDFASQSIIVNGETIKEPIFTTLMSYDTIVEISISWSASSGNASSANLLFYIQPEDNITGTGTYATGSDTLPTENNFTAMFALASTDLAAWNGAYNTYIPSGSSYKADGNTLKVSNPAITYKSKSINQYIYLVQTTQQEDGTTTQTCQLSWFTSGGNDQNAIIGFSISDEYYTFFGSKWDGEKQPTDYNFMGTTQPNPPSNWMVDALLALEGIEKSAEDAAEDAIHAAEDAAKDVADGTKDATDATKNAADEAVKATEDATKDAADEAAKAAKDAADEAKNAADDAKNAADGAAKEAKNAADAAAKQAKNAADALNPFK